jgi:hypothetical protein
MQCDIGGRHCPLLSTHRLLSEEEITMFNAREYLHDLCLVLVDDEENTSHDIVACVLLVSLSNCQSLATTLDKVKSTIL